MLQNLEHLRAEQFLPKLAELCITMDETAFTSFVFLWSAIPACCFDNEKVNWHWYRWETCKMCHECYHEFATKFPSIVKQMEFHDKQLSEKTICDMYSPRMRKLFWSCAEASYPPDLSPPMDYALQRREVYMQTMSQCRAIIH